jgi:thioesterase domain-containing protein
VAYEAAQQLAADGDPVDLVVLLDVICQPRPTFAVTRSRLDRLFTRGGFSSLARGASRRLLGRGTALPDTPPPMDAAAAAAAPFVPGSTDVVLDRESVEWREGTWARHVPRAVSPVMLLRTREGREWTPGYHALGWDRAIDVQWDVLDVPGGHHTMLGEPYVRVVGERVAAALTAATVSR